MKENMNHPDTLVDILEHPKGKSEVIPNQALHIREIMQRALRGQILTEVQQNNLEYGDDEDFDDTPGMEVDLTDVEETQERITYLQQRIDQMKSAQKSEVQQTQQGEVQQTELQSPKDK